MVDTAALSGVDLYWLPLGAGGRSVRLNGIVYEALVARRERRDRYDLYHSALEIHLGCDRFVIEMTPLRTIDDTESDVRATGAVGARWAGRFRAFRYEVRCRRGGVIPDVAEAVDSPRRVIRNAQDAARVWDLASSIPAPVWGRDELRTGDMWNSNSVVAWLLARSGVDVDAIRPPPGGRAPGWQAGTVLAHRQMRPHRPDSPGRSDSGPPGAHRLPVFPRPGV